MNRPYSRGASFAGVALAVTMLVISPVMALGARTADGGAFCTNLQTKATSITNHLSSLKSKISTTWQNQDTRLAALASTVDQKIATDRGAADAKRQVAFAKLEAKATTDGQKTAVTTYENSVMQAVATRRAAFDAARTAFRTGVKNAILTRRSTLSDQADTFATTVNAALTAAESSCTDGTVSATAIRQTLVSSLRNARQTFVSNRQGDNKVGIAVRQLAVTRNAAFKAADQTFHASLKTAAAALKAAFGSDAAVVD